MKPINPPINVPEDKYTKPISFKISYLVLKKCSCVEIYFGSASPKNNDIPRINMFLIELIFMNCRLDSATVVINVSSMDVTAPSTGSGKEINTATTLVNGEMKIIMQPAYITTFLLHTRVIPMLPTFSLEVPIPKPMPKRPAKIELIP